MLNRAILKSVGGKGQQAKELLEIVPPNIQTYYEPFAGSLALFWALRDAGLIRGAVVNDMNPLIAEVYQTTQQDAQRLVDALDQMRQLKGRDVFEQFRSDLNAQPTDSGWVPLTSVERSARTLYLNRRGFNGLFRVNRAGKLNMPWGEDAPLVPSARILEASELLRDVTIYSNDFELAIRSASRGDFIFADPPYLGTFSSYTGVFGIRDHRRMERILASLDSIGVRWMVCNSESPEVRQIWRKWRLQQVLCRRNGNSNGEGRGPVPELRISNY